MTSRAFASLVPQVDCADCCFSFVPTVAEWIFASGSRLATVAVAGKDSGNIHIYDGRYVPKEYSLVWYHVHIE